MNHESLSIIHTIEVPCPLCGADESRPLHEVEDFTYGIPGRYTVVRCCGCRHLFLNPRPTDASLLDCYPQHYAPYHGGDDAAPESSDGESSAADEPKSLLRRTIGSIPGLKRFLFWLGQENATFLPPSPVPGRSRLLEIGSADGKFLLAAQQAGWVVDGVEPSREAAQRSIDQGLDVQCGMFSEMQVADASRDAVVYWMVLEHVTDPAALLKESLRVLTPGGLLALSVPNAGAIERHVFGRYWLGYDAPRHLQNFTASQLKRLLREFGFEDPRIIHQPNTRYWYGSVAAWGGKSFPSHRWPQRWMDYFTTEPPAWMRWPLLLPGKLIAMLGCSGRITVVARKPK